MCVYVISSGHVLCAWQCRFTLLPLWHCLHSFTTPNLPLPLHLTPSPPHIPPLTLPHYCLSHTHPQPTSSTTPAKAQTTTPTRPSSAVAASKPEGVSFTPSSPLSCAHFDVFNYYPYTLLSLLLSLPPTLLTFLIHSLPHSLTLSLPLSLHPSLPPSLPPSPPSRHRPRVSSLARRYWPTSSTVS